MHNYLTVLQALARHGLPMHMRYKMQDFYVAVWHWRVAWVVENTRDALASKLYHALKATITKYLGNECGMGAAGNRLRLRGELYDFFSKLAPPLDKLADERDYEFKKQRKRRELSWLIRSSARLGEA